MSEIDITKLLNDAYTVRDEVAKSANTASRVGTLCVDIINSLKIVEDEIPEAGSGGASTWTELSGRPTWLDSYVGSTKPPVSIFTNDIGYLTSTEASNTYLKKMVFDDLFEKVEISTGVYAIKAKYDLYSVGGISAYGFAEDSSSGGVTSFAQLSDVKDLSPLNGQAWCYDNGSYCWKTIDGGGATSLLGLSDVDSNPYTGQVLYYTGGNFAWKTVSGSGATTLADLTDVSSTHSDGQVLYYDSSSSSFKWKTVSSGGATTLAALTDVSSTHSDGQVLYYDSSSSSFKWKTVSSGGGGASSWTDLSGRPTWLDSYVGSTKPPVSIFTNDIGYLVSTDLDNYVTLDGDQTITGKKTFSQQIEANKGIAFNEGNIDASGNIHLQSSGNSWNIFTDSTNNYKIFSLYGSGTLRVGESGRTSYSDLGQGTLELYQAMPYIDFHYATSGVDYIVRLLNNAEGVLELDAMNASGSVIDAAFKIGSAYIKYDSTNNALYVTGKDGATINFYATGGVSAYSALGGFDTLTDLTLTNKLTSKDANITGTATIGTSTVGTSTVGTSTITTANITTATITTLTSATAKKIVIGDSGQEVTDIQGDGNYVYLTVNSKKYKLSVVSVTSV